MEHQADKLVPLFRLGNTVLIGLIEDHLQGMPHDSLLVKIGLDGRLVRRPHSGQLYMKHVGCFEAVPENDRDAIMIRILELYGAEAVNEIVEMFTCPLFSSKDMLFAL